MRPYRRSGGNKKRHPSKLQIPPRDALRFTPYRMDHEVLSSKMDDVLSHFRLIGDVQAGSRKVLLDAVPFIWNDVSVLVKSGTAARSPLLRNHGVVLDNSELEETNCLQDEDMDAPKIVENSSFLD